MKDLKTCENISKILWMFSSSSEDTEDVLTKISINFGSIIFWGSIADMCWMQEVDPRLKDKKKWRSFWEFKKNHLNSKERILLRSCW